MNRYLIFTPLVSGCLLNFSPFEENKFIADYSEKICSQYVDCIDGVADGDTQTADSLSPSPFDTCVDWVQAPQAQGCAPNAERALQCYAELEILESTMSASGECSTLWTGEALPSCATTYLNCITDKPFGTVPPKVEASPPVITLLNPIHGPETGNTLITIEGSGFDATTEVFFGDAAGEIVENKEDGLLVRTPSVPASGRLSVTVTNALGTTEHSQQFRFWEDISGKTGVFGYLNAFRTIGGYWNESFEFTSASMKFLSSSNPPIVNYRTELRIQTTNGCKMVGFGENEVNYSTVGVQYPDLSIHGSSSSFDLSYVDAGTFSYSSERVDVFASTDYTLTADGINGWPSFEVDRAFTVPRPLDISRPKLSDSEMPEYPGWEYVPFSWIAEGSSYITLRISENLEFKRFLGCSFIDSTSSGAVATQEIPPLGEYFDGGSILYVEACRVNETEPIDVAPINNGRIDVATAQCTLGGLYIY